jgi:hypothetical protein
VKRTFLTEEMSAAEFGPFVYHDVGDFPYVSLTNDYAFGPFMAVEENTSLALLLYWYWKLTGDNRFVSQNMGILEVLMQSLINRDSNSNGIADVGHGWSTYDVSKTLKTAPDNVYLGVKQLAYYIVTAEMLKSFTVKHSRKAISVNESNREVQDGEGVGHTSATNYDNTFLRNAQTAKYLAEANKILDALKKASKKYGYVPVSLDEKIQGWNQHSVVLGEGLMYPALCNTQSDVLIDLATILKPSYILAFEKSKEKYGIRLTSGEPLTWFSKIMVSDYVASRWFEQNNSSANFTCQWNINNRYAYNDGAFSEIKAWPGNWYPRGISALLYLFNEKNFEAGKKELFLEGCK